MPAKIPITRARRPRLAPILKAAPRTYDWWLWTGRPTFEGVCDALAFQYAVLDELIQPLLTDGWRKVARLDRWRAAVRLAHLTAAAEEVVAATQGAPGLSSELDAVDWFRQRSPSTAADTAEAVARARRRSPRI